MQIKESEIQLYRPYQNNLVIFLQQEDILKKSYLRAESLLVFCL